MTFETIVWFLLPTILCAFILFQTTANSIRGKNLISWLLTIGIWVVIIYSLLMLRNMYFKKFWASFFPHMLIAMSILVLLLQATINRIRKSELRKV